MKPEQKPLGFNREWLKDDVRRRHIKARSEGKPFTPSTDLERQLLDEIFTEEKIDDVPERTIRGKY